MGLMKAEQKLPPADEYGELAEKKIFTQSLGVGYFTKIKRITIYVHFILNDP
jgi:hypothetical protein